MPEQLIVRLPGSAPLSTKSMPSPLSGPSAPVYTGTTADFPDLGDGAVHRALGAWSERPVRVDAVSPPGSPAVATTPSPLHTVPASPSPSELAAGELAESLDLMAVDEDGLTSSVSPESTQAALQAELAHWRHCAEHWHSVCLGMQQYIAVLSNPLPTPYGTSDPCGSCDGCH